MRGFITVLLLSGCSMAGAAEQPSIEVSAMSEIQVVPDEVILYLAAHTRDKHLSIAKRDNDEVTTAVMEVFPRYQIPDEDIKITDLDLTPITVNSIPVQKLRSPMILSDPCGFV